MQNPLSVIGGMFRRKASFGELEAGRMARRLSNWVPSRAHVNTLIGASGKTVVARARYLCRNNGYAAGAVDCFAGNLIGVGIQPSWKLDETRAAQKASIQAAFTAWTDECDAEGVTDLYGLQRRIGRELFIAGECFVRRRPRRISDGLSVPLQLELLPSEQLPSERNLYLDNGNRVRQGIEFDKIGRRVAYHFWKVHPGDITQSQNFGEITIVPAADVLHIHDPLESGQIRGLSKLTPAIVSLWMLDQYDDAELERKKTAALFSVFIKRQEAQPGFIDKLKEAQAASAAGPANSGTATVNLQPGVAHVLFPGEDVSTSAPADVGPGYDAFQYRSLTKFCAAVGLPYSSTTADTVKANYGSQRAAMLEMRRRMEALQHGVIVFQFCRPVANWFLDAAVMAGTLKLAGYASAPAPWRLIDWIAPPWDWIDPLKDIQAEIMMIDSGIKPRSRTVQQTGFDPIQNDNQIADDHKREKALDLTFVGVSGPTKEIANPPDDGVAPADGNDNSAANDSEAPARLN